MAGGEPARVEGSVARPADGSSLAELEALYRERKEAAFEKVHEADVAFMLGMIGHHAQALTMSGYAPENGASASIRTLAARIINAQKDEIALMQRWLADRSRPVPEVAPDGTVTWPAAAGEAMDHGDHPAMDHGAAGHDVREGMEHEGMDPQAMSHEGMPGMLSPAQLEELSRARGEAFDRLYLRYMIQHHQGAVTMVLDLFGTDGAAQDDAVFKIASDIQVDQRSEIARMQRMLDAMTAAGSGGDAPPASLR